MAKLYVGLSGFSYREWVGEGKFYPVGTKAKEFFQYYATRYNASEGVGMWYSLPSENSISDWIAGSPDEFKVSPKMHQRVTHLSRLKPSGFVMLGEFVEAVKPLKGAGKCGPILVQLPPNLKRDDALLEAFLQELKKYPGYQWAFDFRNPSWQSPEVEAVFKNHGLAWVAEDTDEVDAERRDTTDFLYVRLRRLAYDDDQLKEWCSFFKAKLKEGKDVYVYCRHKDVPAPWVWADRILELTS